MFKHECVICGRELSGAQLCTCQSPDPHTIILKQDFCNNQTGEPATPKKIIQTGMKFDSEKTRWRLLPWDQLKEVAEILTFGAKKYKEDNWKHVADAEKRYTDATLRHFTTWLQGEKVDPESGRSHLAHAVCNLLFLMWFDKKGVDNGKN